MFHSLIQMDGHRIRMVINWEWILICELSLRILWLPQPPSRSIVEREKDADDEFGGDGGGGH